MKPLMVTAMHGLGDAVWQRPFLRAQSEVRPVYACTPWPETYSDLPGVHPVAVSSRYRTQARNIARLAGFPWEQPPAGCDKAQFSYGLARPGTICQELERHVGLAGRPFVFDAPDFGPPPFDPPYAVIRPVSARVEWLNTARNPDPAYIARAAQLLKAAGYRVICVADLAPGAETLVGEMPEADDYRTAGELSQPELFALVKHAAVVVGGIGWIVPTCLAYRTPTVIVCGGLGAHNAPEIITDPRIDSSAMRFLLPRPYCLRCRNPRHACPKTIPDFDERFMRALAEITVPGAQAAA